MLKKTPLYEAHLELNAKMVPFAGWEMPVQYRGIMEEHCAVRQKAGLFDVSHMGEIRLKGPRALELVQKLTTNDVSRLKAGQAQYSTVLNERGGIIDDLIVYRLGEEEFFIVPNASNAEKVFRWMKEREIAGAEISDECHRWGEIALQGPQSQELLQKIVSLDLSKLSYFYISEGQVAGIPVMIARTGYTGEDGFEIFSAWEHAPSIWKALLDTGKDLPLEPCGLGARNTLRLEMKYALHGNDIDETTNPLEAGLGWVVKLDKGDFVGKSALLKAKEEGLKRRLIGFELLEPGVPREHYPVVTTERQIGTVTSGAFAPWLKKGIGMAYVEMGYHQVGAEFYIKIREKAVRARVVETPFWKGGTAGRIKSKEV